MEHVTVLDMGSSSIKAGYTSGVPTDGGPDTIAPSIVRSLDPSSIPETPEALAAALASAPTIRPIERGRIQDWDALEELFYSVLYNDLKWKESSEGFLLITEPILTSRIDRERLTQLLFEAFNIHGLYVCDAGVASLYAMGKVTGCSVDIGDGKVDIAPVVDGQLQAGATRVEFGGGDLTASLGALLRSQMPRNNKSTKQPQSSISPLVLDQLKMASMRSAPNADEFAAWSAVLRDDKGVTQEARAAATAAQVSTQTHTLPDGQSFTIRDEGLLLGEAFFSPARLAARLESLPASSSSLPGGAAFSLSTAISTLSSMQPLAHSTYTACQVHMDSNVRRMMTEGAFVCGGGSNAWGVQERFFGDLEAYTPPSYSLTGNPCPEYMPTNTMQFAAWTGGIIVSRLVFAQAAAPTTNVPVFLTKGEYSDAGPRAIHKKCQ